MCLSMSLLIYLPSCTQKKINQNNKIRLRVRKKQGFDVYFSIQIFFCIFIIPILTFLFLSFFIFFHWIQFPINNTSWEFITKEWESLKNIFIFIFITRRLTTRDMTLSLVWSMRNIEEKKKLHWTKKKICVGLNKSRRWSGKKETPLTWKKSGQVLKFVNVSVIWFDFYLLWWIFFFVQREKKIKWVLEINKDFLFNWLYQKF